MFSEKTCLKCFSLGLLQSLAKQWFRNTSYVRKIQPLCLKMLIKKQCQDVSRLHFEPASLEACVNAVTLSKLKHLQQCFEQVNFLSRFFLIWRDEKELRLYTSSLAFVTLYKVLTSVSFFFFFTPHPKVVLGSVLTVMKPSFRGIAGLWTSSKLSIQKQSSCSSSVLLSQCIKNLILTASSLHWYMDLGI